MLKKIGLLYSKCQPPAGWSGVEKYAYDSSRLERLDKLRHGIVHKDGLGKAIPNTDDEIQYMMNTTWHLTALAAAAGIIQAGLTTSRSGPALVNYKYNLKIGPAYLSKSSIG